MSFAQYLGVPAYFYPGTSDYWERLIAAGTRHVIVNPSSGPGGAEDPLYTAQIEACQAVGAKCYGYVATTYGAKAAATLNGEVDDWYSFYPDINGIFFDEVSSDEADIVYYQTARAYVVSVATPGYGKVVLNPGTIPDEIYMSNADIVVTFEDSYANYLTYTAPSWVDAYSSEKYWHIIHTCTEANMPNAITLSKNRRAGVVFVTDDVMANPYDTMPPSLYYTAEAAAVAVVPDVDAPEVGEEVAADSGTMPTAFSHNSHRYGDKHKLIEFNRNGEVPLLFTTLPALVNQHWIPAIDNYYDLGSQARRWRDIYIGRNASIDQNLNVYGYADVRGLLTGRTGIKVGTSILPYSGTPNVGGNAVGERMGTGYFGALDVTNNTASGTLSVSGLSTLTGGLRTGAAVQTSGVGAHDIGTNANPFKDLYITGEVYKNGVPIGSPGTSGYQHLYPEIDNTYDIGSLAKRWRTLRVEGESVLKNIYPYVNNTGYVGTYFNRFASGSMQSVYTGALLPIEPNGFGGAGNIGTAIDYWLDAYIRRIHAYDISASNNLSGEYIYGQTLAIYNNAVIKDLTVTGTLTHNGITAGGGGGYPSDIVARTVIPASDNIGNIGAFGKRYNAGYFNNIDASIITTHQMVASDRVSAPVVNSGTLAVRDTATIKDLIVTGTITGISSQTTHVWPVIFYWAKPFMPIENRNWFMGDYYNRSEYKKDFWSSVLQFFLSAATTAAVGGALGVGVGAMPAALSASWGTALTTSAGVALYPDLFFYTAISAASQGAPIVGQITQGGVAAAIGAGLGLTAVQGIERFYNTITNINAGQVARYKRCKGGYVLRSTKQIQQIADGLHCTMSYVIRCSSFVEGGNIPDTTQFAITHMELFSHMTNPIRMPTGQTLEAAVGSASIPIGICTGYQIKNTDLDQYARRHLQGYVNLLKTEVVNADDGTSLPLVAVEMIWEIDSESKPSFNDDFELQAKFIVPLKSTARCDFMMIPYEPQMPVKTGYVWDPYWSNRI